MNCKMAELLLFPWLQGLESLIICTGLSEAHFSKLRELKKLRIERHMVEVWSILKLANSNVFALTIL